MRKTLRALTLAVLAMLSTAVLGVVAAVTAALALAATAFIVPGTGTHNINPPMPVMGYKENAQKRYIGPAYTPCDATCNLQGVDYPASFFPIPLPGWCPGLSCDTWNVSVGTGVQNLTEQVNGFFADPANADEHIVVFGYSQGGAVVSHYMYSIPEDLRDQVTVVTIGNIENPQGLWSRLSFLPTIPILNITFGPQLPTDIGVKSYNYSFEYDPVGDAPAYWGNPLAMLNALAAFEYVHGYYLSPNTNAPTDQLPYGYNDTSLAGAIDNALSTCNNAGSTCRTYHDATFVLIPQQGNLPIYQPFVDLAKSAGLTSLVQPLVDLASPVTKVLINLGYNRTINPGIAQPLSILPFNPFQNPLTVAADLINAGIQGIQAFVTDLGGLPSTLTTPVPTGSTTVSTLAASQTPLSLKKTSTETPVSTTAPVTAPKVTDPAGELTAAQLTPTTPLVLTAPTLPKNKAGNLFTPGKPAPVVASSSPSTTTGTTTSTTTGPATPEGTTTATTPAAGTTAGTPASSPAAA
jgi:hypothetical protein